MQNKKKLRNGVLAICTSVTLLLTSCTTNDESTTIENATTENATNAEIDNKALTAKIGDNFYANRTGTDNGFFYTIDKDGSMGSAYMNFDGAATYKGNFTMAWNGVKQVVGGKGWSAGSNRVINYNVGSLSGAVKFVGVYGWTTSPLTEYYIVEMGPGAIYNKGKVGTGATTVTYTADNRQYALTRAFRKQAPSIKGTADFWQVESLRTGAKATKGQNNSVTMTTHFTNWRKYLNTSAGNTFGVTTGGGYMVFGCEAYDYTSTNASVTGSINATIW